MATFEELGQVVDRELQKLKTFFEQEIKPTTKRSAVEALRAASSRLTELANDLEKRFPDTPGKSS